MRTEQHSRRLDRLERMLRLTRGALELDPSLALSQIRIVTEELLRDAVAEKTGLDQTAKALDALLQSARTVAILPEATCLHVRTIQAFGNSAIHGRLAATLTASDVEPALAAFLRVVEWYCCDYLGEDGPGGRRMSSILAPGLSTVRSTSLTQPRSAGSIEEAVSAPQAIVTFHDGNDLPSRSRVFPLAASVAALLEDARAVDPCADWLVIRVAAAKRLERICVLGGPRGALVHYEIAIADLVKSGPEEGGWRDTAGRLLTELGERAHRIMAAMQSSDLSFTWGGPESAKTSRSEADVMYYVDATCAFITCEKRLSSEAESIVTISLLTDAAIELSQVVDECVTAVLGSVARGRVSPD